MHIEILDGNDTAAHAAKLCRVKVVPCFPITPQTEIIEKIAKWKAEGIFSPEFIVMESEHSVLSAALGSEMTGARTFTASSSQGLMLMHEILPIVSGTRMPVLMVNVSRGLSAPITLWADHNDFLAMRDSGWLMFVSETNQEIMDMVIMGYKIGENRKLRLPVLINMDGYIHSYTRTEVEVPSQSFVDDFLPKLKLDTRLDVSKPMSLGTPVMEEYMYFRSQLHKAHMDAKPLIKKVFRQFEDLTGREHDVVETDHLTGAEAAIVIMGANTTIARAAVENLRKKGEKVGLLKIKAFRPFPYKEIEEKLEGIERIAVMDQNIAPGASGILYPEVKSAIYENDSIVSNFIFGLGGKPTSQKDFEAVLKRTLKSKKEERVWLL
jgi:pyruvate ferredoxin oxidoreductase alpha subunit